MVRPRSSIGPSDHTSKERPVSSGPDMFGLFKRGSVKVNVLPFSSKLTGSLQYNLNSYLYDMNIYLILVHVHVNG